MTQQWIQRSGDLAGFHAHCARTARRAGTWILSTTLALSCAGCGVVDMFDSTEPVAPSRARSLSMRPAPALGSATAPRPGTSPGISPGNAIGLSPDDTMFGPRAGVSQINPAATRTQVAANPPVQTRSPDAPAAVAKTARQATPAIVVEPEVVPEVGTPIAGTESGRVPVVAAPERVSEVPVTPPTSRPAAVAPVPEPEAITEKPPVAEKVVSLEQQRLRARIEELKKQIKDGIDVNEKDDRGRTLLQQAAITGDLEIVELLLDWGANVRAVDRQGWTALHWAASSGHQEICELLIASGTAVNARGWLDDTALHWAAVFDRRDVVELLLARGADVNLVDKRGKSALHAAVENDARATAIVLIAQGADLKLRDESGLTPLHAAVLQCRKALVDLSAGETLPGDATSASAKTASEAAKDRSQARESIIAHSKEMVKLLLSKGADANSSTVRGVTPLHLSAWDDTREIAELLVSMGADPLAKDARERTPLDYAKQRGQSGVSTVLAVAARE